MTSTKTVFDIIPDLEFDIPTLPRYYSTGVDPNCGNGDDD
jgi:hypothetical protein